MKKILSFTYARTIIFGIFFVIPFLFGGQAKASTLNPGIISSCGEIIDTGTYTLNQNIGSGGACLTITSGGSADQTIIDGNGHTIDGDVNGSGGYPVGYNFTLQNVTVTGDVNSNGGDGQGIPGFDENGNPTGSATDGAAGGSIVFLNSQLNSVNANGGNGGDGGTWMDTNGGNGGTITLTNSTAVSNFVGGGVGGPQRGTSGSSGTVNLNSLPGPISKCMVIYNGGTYTLAHNIGTGGSCLNIQSDGVTIDGGGFTLNGNITGAGGAEGTVDDSDNVTSGTSGIGFAIQNITVTGTITSGSGGSGGSANNTSSGGSGAAGGSITITNSTTTSVTSGGGGSGGTGANGNGGGPGAAGGSITITNSTTTSVTVGNGGNGGSAWGGGYNGSGSGAGDGGSLTITNSTTTSFTVGNGGNGGSGGSGGSGGNGGSLTITKSGNLNISN